MTPVLEFPDARRWRAWLARNRASPEGVWLKIAKKGSSGESVSYAEALDEALCSAGSAGRRRPRPPRLPPEVHSRRSRSIWSRRNIEHCERLIAAGKMEPSGQAEIDRARADRRWADAYDPPSRAEPPDDLVRALARNRSARRFFETLDRTSAPSSGGSRPAKRPETRARRLEAFVQMLADGRKIHP